MSLQNSNRDYILILQLLRVNADSAIKPIFFALSGQCVAISTRYHSLKNADMKPKSQFNYRNNELIHQSVCNLNMAAF